MKRHRGRINASVWSRARNRFDQSLLLRNATAMLAALATRTIIQALYFVLVARLLGVEGYGAFVGVVALVALLVPFVSLGFGNILVQQTSRRRDDFEEYWGDSLAVTLVAGSFLTLITLGIVRFALPADLPIALVISVTVSDLIFARLLDLCGYAFQAVERLKRTGQFLALLSAARLTAAVLLFLTQRDPTPVSWGNFYLGSTVLSALLALLVVRRELGTAKARWSSIKANLKSGFYFSIDLSAQSVYNNIDKTMLASLSTLRATGLYGAAYRIIDVAVSPISSLFYAAHARFYREGVEGISGSFRLTRKLMPISAGYATAVGVTLLITAPILPILLGSGFRESTEALRWLAFVPLIKTIHFFAAQTLTGAGFHRFRSGNQVFIALLNVGLNAWLIPIYSWRGAAWATLFSEGLLGLLLWLGVRKRLRRAPSL